MSTRTSYDPALENAYHHCAGIIKAKAHSFHFASRFLPSERRRDVYALYAFCRTVDDIADLPRHGGDEPERLDIWRRWLLAGAPSRPDDPIKYALAHTVRAYDLPLMPLVELIDGVCEDLYPRHLADSAALERYCYCVAGTVGIVMAVLLGAREKPAPRCACDLGIAMQMTNVLRDVGEDLASGRIYLPAGDMDRYGYRREDLERGVVDDRFIALIRLNMDRAREYYERGLRGLSFLPRESRFPIALAAHTYAGILEKIERAGYDVFIRRAHTRRRDKLLLAARLYLHQSVMRDDSVRGGQYGVVEPMRVDALKDPD